MSRSKRKQQRSTSRSSATPSTGMAAGTASTESQSPKLSLSISDRIQVIVSLLTFLSVIGVFLTLGEMKKDRDAAYKPAVLMNAANYQITWDAEGLEDWAQAVAVKDETQTAPTADDDPTDSLRIPFMVRPSNLENLSVVNIGVGAARNIMFEWDENNLSRLSDTLTKCNPHKADFGVYGKSATFSLGKGVVVTDTVDSARLMYMLPNAEETYTIPLPTAYSVLIHEIMKCESLPEPPHIILYASYSDIQGNEIHDTFLLTANRLMYAINEDGSGTALYQLTPALLPK